MIVQNWHRLGTPARAAAISAAVVFAVAGGLVTAAYVMQWGLKVPLHLPRDLLLWPQAALAGYTDPETVKWIKLSGYAGLLPSIVIAAAILKAQPKPDVHGRAEFARARDIRQAGMRSKAGLIAGFTGSLPSRHYGKRVDKWGRSVEQGGAVKIQKAGHLTPKNLLMYGGDEHVLLYAPTRSGKGVGVVIPNLLNWPDSAVVLDIKKENWTLTAGFRKAGGQEVFLFDPLDPDGRTHRWNPLSTVRRGTDYQIEDLQRLADLFIPVASKDPFFDRAAQTAFVGVGGYLAETPERPFTLGEIYRQLTLTPDFVQTFRKRIEVRKATGRPLSLQTVSTLNDFLSKSENTFESVKSTITANLGLFANPMLDRATAASDFAFADLRRKRMTIYVGITPNTLDSVRKDLTDLNRDGAAPSRMTQTNMDFWTGYHERAAEKASPEKQPQDQGSIVPSERQKAKPDQDRFDLPSSYHDRFLVTKAKGQQDLYRSYDDARPAIIDKGDQLSTRNADRGTAMDMIELASHRGWQSLKAKGPEEFRREMWLEGTAQGLKVQGYRPTEKDQEEATRRSQMIGERAIERTDRASLPGNAKTPDREDQQAAPRQSYSDGISGKITDIGTAPYRNREGADPVPFIALTNKAGKEEHIWSVTLPAALEKHDLKLGDRATFFSLGVEPVTYKTKDQKTGEEVERQGHRRLWDAKDIEREAQPQRASQGKSAAKATTEETPMADKQREQDTKSDRLEDRIKRYEPGDHAAKGPASVLAHMDARLRAEGVSEKDRETARDYAAKLLSQGMKAGRHIPVQRLANVTKEQEAQVHGATTKEARVVPERKILDQTKGSRSR